MSTAAIVILVLVLLAVLFAAGWFLGGQARSRRLRNRFGPEYDRRLEETEDRRVVERELTEREKRHAQLDLKPLSADARARYTEQWTRVQEQFVDEPVAAVAAADDLVHTVMRERGYPTEDHDQEAADLSVEHAAVVAHYRSGHEIRTHHESGETDTEDLRQAMVHYRAVFHALVGEGDTTESPRDAREAARDAGRDDARNAPHGDARTDARTDVRTDAPTGVTPDARTDGLPAQQPHGRANH